jgi:ribulose-5-phosphate 4-epimerase/fuculose-1-phosphate aldolase
VQGVFKVLGDRDRIANAMAQCARMLHDQGLAPALGGSLSHRLGEGLLVTAAGAFFGRLSEDDLAYCDLAGEVALDGPKPSRELALHVAVYSQRPDVTAMVQVRSPASVALSCLVEPTESGNVLPMVTPQAVLRVGRVPMLEYMSPGAPAYAARLGRASRGVNAVLLQNQGLAAFGRSLAEALGVAEEFEQTAKIWLMTYGSARCLADKELLALGGAVLPGMQRPRLMDGVQFGGLRL